jgi:hypothetical protein
MHGQQHIKQLIMLIYIIYNANVKTGNGQLHNLYSPRNQIKECENVVI